MLIRTVPPEVAESSSETYTKPVNFFFSIFAVLEDSVVAIAVVVFPSCIQRQPLLSPLSSRINRLTESGAEVKDKAPAEHLYIN